MMARPLTDRAMKARAVDEERDEVIVTLLNRVAVLEMNAIAAPAVLSTVAALLVRNVSPDQRTAILQEARAAIAAGVAPDASAEGVSVMLQTETMANAILDQIEHLARREI